ncbi:DUF2339 domain-containing protein [Siphonobacter aquaeclarae]|uniref:Predicted membrane protein n=1 Tax=Siphonobacter aquaeclarae TaxID=563176 RepID=A0A1G9KU02_9BACT|nr:DUF2339 domain-containing protein [Siphonobacter aquaeclarae]SDL52953.1 Predicted membrane protein [Siphonobacter aquaeclarae]
MEEESLRRLQDEVERLSRQLTDAQQQLQDVRRQLHALAGRPSGVPIPPPAPAPKPAPIPPRPIAKAPTEAYIGGNLLSKVGIAALVIGMAIFVKYAFDNDLIGPWGRLLMGWGIGCGLVALALFLKPRYLTYSAVLLSGGVATVYFTTYASFYFYHFVPSPVAFAVMVATTLVTVWLATLYDVEWIGLFGLVGAYAVPFLVGGNGAPWGLFTYMTILNTGVLVLSYRKDWRKMNLFAFLVTWTIFVAFVLDSSRPGYFWTSLVFGSIFFLMLYAALLIHDTAANSRQAVLIILNALVFLVAGRIVLKENPDWILFLAANAGIHAGVAWWLRVRNRSLSLTAWSLCIVSGIVLEEAAVGPSFLLLTGMAGAWAFYLTGLQRSMLFLVRWGIVLAVLSVLVLFRDLSLQAVDHQVTAYMNSVFVKRFVALTLLGGMVWAGFYRFHDRRSASWLGALLFLAAYPAGWMECYLHGLAGSSSFTLFTGTYLGISLLLIARDAGPVWRAIGLVLSVVLWLYLLADQPFSHLRTLRLAHPDTSGALRYALYAAVALATAGCFLVMRKASSQRVRQAAVYLPLAAAWYLGSEELVSLFVGTDKTAAADHYQQAYHAGWSVLWGVYSFVLVGIGFGRQWKPFRLAGITLFGIVVAKLLLYDLSGLSSGGKIVVFLSVGVLLLLASFLYQKFRLPEEKKEAND